MGDLGVGNQARQSGRRFSSDTAISACGVSLAALLLGRMHFGLLQDLKISNRPIFLK
jgi:hypothetical protein